MKAFSVFDEDCLQFHNFKIAAKMLGNEAYREKITRLFVRKTIENLKTLKLYEDCNFDILSVVEATVRRVVTAQASGAQGESVLGYAPTQAGKTSYKAVEIACMLTMAEHMVLVTKGKKECEELSSKLAKCLNSSTKGSVFENQICCVYDSSSKEAITSKFKEEPSTSFCLVIPDTHNKIDLAEDVTRKTKAYFNSWGVRFNFSLIMDECDAIENRSHDRDEKNEQAMKRLKIVGPIYETRVTATPMPMLMEYLENPENNILPTLFPIKPKANYVGVKSLQAPESNGKEQFLDVASLEKGFFYENNKSLDAGGMKRNNAPLFRNDKRLAASRFNGRKKKRTIPFWNDQCNQLLDTVFKEREKGNEGHLILVGTSPWVNKEPGNIFEQATYVQDFCFSSGQRFIAVCVNAEDISYRYPGQKFGHKCYGKPSICDFLNAIDKDKRFGLNIPVVIFGYNKLKRSISYRSDQRVPSHVIMYPRMGQSCENVRQAIGRVSILLLPIS